MVVGAKEEEEEEEEKEEEEEEEEEEEVKHTLALAMAKEALGSCTA